MPRVKRGKGHVKRRKNLLKRAKGFRGTQKRSIKHARTAVTKAGVHAFRGRKVKKRVNRANWQIRINAAVRQYGLTYGKFIDGLKKAKIELDRKVLSQLAADHPKVFEAIVAAVKKS